MRAPFESMTTLVVAHETRTIAASAPDTVTAVVRRISQLAFLTDPRGVYGTTGRLSMRRRWLVAKVAAPQLRRRQCPPSTASTAGGGQLRYGAGLGPPFVFSAVRPPFTARDAGRARTSTRLFFVAFFF